MQYKKSIIGRKHEQEILQECLDSTKAEFIAVYGRRRIGKTYLVKQFFEEKFDFYATGVYNISRTEQLKRWKIQLQKHSGEKTVKPKDWFEAFDQLQKYLESLADKKRIVIFIDELPWMDTPKSNFIRALEFFWNSWAADRKGLKLVVCGSATTWMTNKLIGDKGGLHNRVTRPIHLAPFTLAETKQYLECRGMDWSHNEIMETYMTLGGTPFYLYLLRPNLSLRQNVDALFFGNDAPLRTEYDILFRSLFNDAIAYRKIVELLSGKLKGLTRLEIMDGIKATDNGNLSEILENLEKCDFIRHYQAFGKKQRDVIYQLTDMYTLFYLRFVKGYNGMNDHAWSNIPDKKRNTWQGYAFEQVCILHINQIKKALGISGIASDVCSWSTRGGNKGAQIDLIINRTDNVIDLCEMKYSDSLYELTKNYIEWLKERRDLFKKETRTTKTLHLTMITSQGLANGKYTSQIQSQVTMDDLFVS
jgi:hypothetical protein